MKLKVESYRDAFGQKLVELGEKNKHLIVLDPDVGDSTRTAWFREKFPNRFVNVGISEQDMVGIAAGLSIEGFTPIVATFSMFILRAWEQIRNTLARDNLNVKIVASHGGLSDFGDGSSHQCFEDIALMRVIPEMKTIVPADAQSTKGLFEQAIRTKGPTYIRIGRDFCLKIYENEDDVVLGKVNVLEEGDDLTLVACGLMVPFALMVHKMLLKSGVKSSIVDAHTIKPLDSRLISICRRTGRVVTIEEHSVIGGLGSALCENLSEYGVKVKRIGVFDRFGESSEDYRKLLQKFQLDEDSIFKQVISFVG
ncbi:MAG: transketolase C-terminal domain-containing protein [Nitrososphaeria archaeon]